MFRRKDVKTWYAVLLTVSRRKLGFDSDEIAEILDLRMQPETLAEVVDGKKVFSGFHMNKRHWITVVLDDTLSDGEIFGFIDNSFCLAGTKKAAKTLAKAAGADLYEIQPEVPYSSSDLNWMDSHSRSSVEMKDPASRPKIKGGVENMNEYDVIFVGFPIWWYIAPHIIDTFLESYDFGKKLIVPFATSGGSGIGKAEEALKKNYPALNWGKGKLLNSLMKEAEAKEWIKSIIG